jgi:hypothetical protein
MKTYIFWNGTVIRRDLALSCFLESTETKRALNSHSSLIHNFDTA